VRNFIRTGGGFTWRGQLDAGDGADADGRGAGDVADGSCVMVGVGV
jgi:hypothetical protein